VPAIRSLPRLSYLSAFENNFRAAVIATAEFRDPDPTQWTELTWDPPVSAGAYKVVLSHVKGQWGVYGKAGNLMVQYRPTDTSVPSERERHERSEWGFVPDLAEPGSWVVPFSKHLTEYQAPRDQIFIAPEPFNGIRLSTFPARGTVASGGKMSLEVPQMDEARRMLNQIFAGKLKIWF